MGNSSVEDVLVTGGDKPTAGTFIYWINIRTKKETGEKTGFCRKTGTGSGTSPGTDTTANSFSDDLWTGWSDSTYDNSKEKEDVGDTITLDHASERDAREGWTDTGDKQYGKMHHLTDTYKLEDKVASGSPDTVPFPGTGCCPPYTVTTYKYTTKWVLDEVQKWFTSPVIIDLFETGDISKLAPCGWERGREQRVNPFMLRLFEMVPNSSLRYWEWVSPKAGILIHSVGGPPTKVSGANLFGNFTWNKSWKHGYEPMATLDLDSNGLLQGSELSDIWVWVDTHSRQVKAKMPDSTGDFRLRLSLTTCLGSGSKVINSARSWALMSRTARRS